MAPVSLFLIAYSLWQSSLWVGNYFHTLRQNVLRRHKPEGTVHMSIQHNDRRHCTLSHWLGCALRYRLYPFSRSLLLSVWRRGSPSSSFPTEESVYFNKPSRLRPPYFTQALKCGSQEMKRLRQVKLSSSPHRTFVVVIHSWQNPFTLWQPMSPLIYGVVSCHDPCNVHRSPYSLAHTHPASPPYPSPLLPTLFWISL